MPREYSNSPRKPYSGNPRDSRYPRDSREPREPREHREPRDFKERREPRGAHSKDRDFKPSYNRSEDRRPPVKRAPVKSSLKNNAFSPSIDLIVSLVCAKHDLKSILTSIEALINIKTYSKKIIVALDENFHSEQEFFTLTQKFAHLTFIEFKKASSPNHSTNIAGCSIHARQYLLLDGDVELREYSFEKLSNFLKSNSKEYFAASPRFFDSKGATLKSCRRIPCVKWFMEHKKPEYKGSALEKEFEMSERGLTGYLKIHSVNNPILDCILVDGEFLIKNKPLKYCYASKLLTEAHFAKQISKAGRKIVYFPLARVVKHDGLDEAKANFMSFAKYCLSNGFSLGFKKH
jgi:hypothetical protein